ncbi:MAG TPA: Rieske 2Fe-2S domain-containing protein [Acidimicrobiia bacterium]
MNVYDVAERIGRIESLDKIAGPLADVVRRALPQYSARKDVLNGTWLAHPLHPLLTDIPIGSFTSTTVLDLVGGSQSEHAADLLLKLGLASSVLTAAAGAADWADKYGEESRTGAVHAIANAVGVALYGASGIARRSDRRGVATSLGLAGMAAMTIGGYLGGHLSFSQGVGVNNAFAQDQPREWTAVLAAADLADGASMRVETETATVLLYRRGNEIFAIGSCCSHAGGPLEDGDVDAQALTVTCPWHQSVFRLDNGKVVHGPAVAPQGGYDTRVVNGRIEIRAAGA